MFFNDKNKGETVGFVCRLNARVNGRHTINDTQAQWRLATNQLWICTSRWNKPCRVNPRDAQPSPVLFVVLEILTEVNTARASGAWHRLRALPDWTNGRLDVLVATPSLTADWPVALSVTSLSRSTFWLGLLSRTWQSTAQMARVFWCAREGL